MDNISLETHFELPYIDSKNAVKALIVDSSELDSAILKKILVNFSYQVQTAQTGLSAKEVFFEFSPDIVFLNLNLSDKSVDELTQLIKTNSNYSYIPVIYITSADNKSTLRKRLDAGGDDFVVTPIDAGLLTAKVNSLLRAKKIYDSLLKEKRTLSEHIQIQKKDLNDAKSIISSMHMSRFIDSGNMNWAYIAENILSGDILCSAVNPSGEQMILIGDNTGHGLPAAIGSMITSETFYSMVNKGFDMQVIIGEINKKLFHLFPIDRFLAACIVCFNDEYNEMRIWNAGFPSVLVVDAAGQLKEKVSSMEMALGIKLIAESEIIPIRVDLKETDTIYAFTDGLFEVFNPAGEMYGEERLLESIGSNHRKKGRVDKIINDSMQFQENDKLNDDLLFLEISCDKKLLKNNKKESIDNTRIEPMEWKTRFEFGKDVLCHTNPIPTLVQTINDIQGFGDHREKIFLILTEMYSNALEHGILNLDSSIKNSEDGFLKYYNLRQKNLDELQHGNIAIDIKHNIEGDKGVVVFAIEHDGETFDYQGIGKKLDKNASNNGRGIGLINDFCRKFEYSNKGRKLSVEYEWKL